MGRRTKTFEKPCARVRHKSGREPNVSLGDVAPCPRSLAPSEGLSASGTRSTSARSDVAGDEGASEIPDNTPQSSGLNEAISEAVVKTRLKQRSCGTLLGVPGVCHLNDTVSRILSRRVEYYNLCYCLFWAVSWVSQVSLVSCFWATFVSCDCHCGVGVSRKTLVTFWSFDRNAISRSSTLRLQYLCCSLTETFGLNAWPRCLFMHVFLSCFYFCGHRKFSWLNQESWSMF